MYSVCQWNTLIVLSKRKITSHNECWKKELKTCPLCTYFASYALCRCPANDISLVLFCSVSLTGISVCSFLSLGLGVGGFFFIRLQSVLTDVTSGGGFREEVTHGFFVLDWLLVGVLVALDLGQTTSLDVGLDVEVGEESHKHDRVEAHDVGQDDGEVAFDEEELDRVQENENELDHLHGGQILLPPEVLLVLRSHSGHKVVAVHDHMDEGIEQAEEGTVTSWGELDSPPASGWHDGVVDDVQVGDLIVLLAQYEEDGVQELSDLAEEVPPAHVGHGHLIGIIRVIDRLASQTVLPQPGVDHTLVNEVDANDDLDKVISDDGLFQIHGLTIAHQPRSQRLDEVDVACANSQRIERRTHQKPAISSFISFIDHQIIVRVDDIP